MKVNHQKSEADSIIGNYNVINDEKVEAAYLVQMLNHVFDEQKKQIFFNGHLTMGMQNPYNQIRDLKIPKISLEAQKAYLEGYRDSKSKYDNFDSIIIREDVRAHITESFYEEFASLNHTLINKLKPARDNARLLNRFFSKDLEEVKQFKKFFENKKSKGIELYLDKIIKNSTYASMLLKKGIDALRIDQQKLQPIKIIDYLLDLEKKYEENYNFKINSSFKDFYGLISTIPQKNENSISEESNQLILSQKNNNR